MVVGGSGKGREAGSEGFDAPDRISTHRRDVRRRGRESLARVPLI